jgi:HTH-type transcriptional regulator / antitoxin HigA
MTMTTLGLGKRTYGQLPGRKLPHVIHAEEEYERLTDELMRLDELTDSSREERKLAELLTVLIDEYETRRYPIPRASPQQTLRHLMEARVLTQKDLWKVLGSKGIASEVFHGKRAISRTLAKRLADFFHMGVEYLFSERRREANL